jgi:hypothetical protein
MLRVGAIKHLMSYEIRSGKTISALSSASTPPFI